MLGLSARHVKLSCLFFWMQSAALLTSDRLAATALQRAAGLLATWMPPAWPAASPTSITTLRSTLWVSWAWNSWRGRP